MTGPDRAFIAWPHINGAGLAFKTDNGHRTEYIRRDPAVLAALPEVQALIAAAYEVAATCTEWTAWGQRHNLTEASRRAIRALTPADATAALARIVREAEARGMERAADRARVYASNYEQSSDGRNTFILLAEWADAEAAAILARAEQIERDGK